MLLSLEWPEKDRDSDPDDIEPSERGVGGGVRALRLLHERRGDTSRNDASGEEGH